MLTWSTYRYIAYEAEGGIRDGKYFCKGACLSTDEKPVVGIYNGSMLREIDTSKVYVFDGSTQTWVVWTAGGGSNPSPVSADTATNSEVDEALDELFPTTDGIGGDDTPSGNIASDDDVESALDDIFP